MRWLILGDEWPTASGPPGGVGEWTFRTAKALSVAHEVTVFVRRRRDLRPFPGLVGVRGPSFARWGGWWTALATRRALECADAVLCATWPVATRIAGRHPRIHVVAHGSDVTRPTADPAGRARVFERAIGWGVSAFLARHLPEGGVLPAPIDALPVRPPSSGLRRLGLVARATSLKGGDRFVRLVHAAGLEGEVAGDGPELSRWQALAEALGARVRFRGFVPPADMNSFYSGIDAAILLPRTHADGTGAEGLGMCLLEAAASGVPSVGCATGGVPEACDLVLPSPDDPADCAARLLSWWTPDRGVSARERLAAGHGSARLVHALLTNDFARAR